MQTVDTYLSKAGPIYIENNHGMKPLFLDDETYGLALSSFIDVCADCVIIDKKRHTFYLAKRKVKPMLGWWRIGGRRMVGEMPEESVHRSFKRETGLDLSIARFTYISTQEIIWSDRKEEPQHTGKHDVIFVFSIELNDAEIAYAAAHLDEDEYESTGLTEFTSERLITEKAHPALIEIHQKIFGSITSA